MKQPEGGVTKRVSVTSVMVELSGPMNVVEAWAKNIATKKIVAQID